MASGRASGPQRSPLGLSADPGGFPLYKSGTVVGGVGVLADGFYAIDKDIADSDADADEAIGYAATFGLPRRSIGAATGSRRTARRSASATSTSISCAAIPRPRRRSRSLAGSVGA